MYEVRTFRPVLSFAIKSQEVHLVGERPRIDESQIHVHSTVPCEKRSSLVATFARVVRERSA